MKLSARILSLLLALCLVAASFSACGQIRNEYTDTDKQTFSEEEPEKKDDLLSYTLTEDDLEAFQDLLKENKQKIVNAHSYDEAYPFMDEIEDALDEFRKQSGIAEIIYYCDTGDEDANDRYQYAKETYAEAYTALIDFAVEIFDEDVPFAEELFDGMTEEEMKERQKSAAAEKEHLLIQTDITTRFYELDEDELEEEVHTLYIEYITSGNKLAQTCGYENFYEYATEHYYHRDYGDGEREAFREYVIEYIVPLYEDSMYAFVDSVEDLSEKEWKDLVDLVEETPYDELNTNYVKKYVESLDGTTKDGMMHMFENEYYIATDSDGALEGAFTTVIDDPFCYFGPGYYQTTYTVIHELGHYYAELHADEDVDYSFDICETQSQGNEMLLTAFLEEELDEDVYEALVNYKIYSMSQTVIMATVIDDFEYAVYHNENYASLDTDDLNSIMSDVLEKYGMDLIEPEFESQMQTYWKQVVVTSPVYYISYATSAVASLNLFSLCQEDIGNAREAYRIIAEKVDEERDFINTLKNAGIPSPFGEDAFKDLKDLIIN